VEDRAVERDEGHGREKPGGGRDHTPAMNHP